MDREISIRSKQNVFKDQSINSFRSKLLFFLKDGTNILMMLVLLSKIIIFVLLYANYKQRIIAMCDGINIGIILIGFIAIVYNNAWAFWIHWAIYVASYILLFVIHFTTCRKPDGLAAEHKEIFSNFIFSDVYFFNSIFFTGDAYYKLGKVSNRIHMIMWILLTVSMLFIINFSFTFIYETITFSYCFIFSLLSYYGSFNKKTEVRTNSNQIHSNGKSASLPIKDISKSTQPYFYGTCIVNELLLIRNQNTFFSSYMNDLCTNKVIPNPNIASNDEKQSIKTNKQNWSSSLLISVPNNNHTPLSKNNTGIGLFLNGDMIFLREEEEENPITLKDVFYFKCIYLAKSSPSSLPQYQNEQAKDKLIRLGNFKYHSSLKEGRHFEVYCRAIPKEEQESYQHESLYEITFYELTDNLKIIKLKIEKKYKTLLLRKINHEFKVPIVLIQNMINEIIEASPSLLVKSICKTTKYVTDTILLLVCDLTEYIHLNTLNVEDKEMKSASGFVTIFSLYQDIQNICFVYTKVFNKNVSIQFEISDLLKNAKIVINENKLKQILSIIITNAIKNSSQVYISFNVKENKQSKDFQRPSRCFTNAIQTVEHAAFQPLAVNQINFSPKVKIKEYSPDYEIIMAIEDNGPGIDKRIIHNINSSSNHLSDTLSPVMTFNSYKNEKGFGTGLMIAMKLCNDLNITLNCDIIGNEAKVEGTIFSLSIKSDITFEDLKNESCIVEYTDYNESSNCSRSSQSAMTKEIFIDDFHLGIINDVQLKNKVERKSPLPSSRKSRTCLFYKSRYGYNFGEHISISPIQVINFTINAVIRPKTYKINKSKKYSEIPLFNDSERDCSIHSHHTDKSVKEYNKTILIQSDIEERRGTNYKGNHRYYSSDKIKKKNSFNAANLAKLKGFKNHSRRGSMKGISLFYQDSKKAKNIKPIPTLEKKDEKSKDEYHSNNSSINDEDKGVIVIVDDIDSNKKAIYSLVLKQLIKRNKGDTYEFKLLSDGIELINLFYAYQSKNKKIKIIICDESMNYLNGSEAFTIIKRISLAKSIKLIPFILCSAFSDNGFKEQMVSIGIKNLYEKPLQSSNIERIIQEFEL